CIGHLSSRGSSTQIGGMQATGSNLLNCTHQVLTGILLPQMLKHHHRSPKSRDWVGNALSSDIEGRAVNGLEHRREGSVGIEVGRWRYPQAARKGCGQIREDIGMKVCGHDDVKLFRLQYHCGSNRVH